MFERAQEVEAELKMILARMEMNIDASSKEMGEIVGDVQGFLAALKAR